MSVTKPSEEQIDPIDFLELYIRQNTKNGSLAEIEPGDRVRIFTPTGGLIRENDRMKVVSKGGENFDKYVNSRMEQTIKVSPPVTESHIVQLNKKISEIEKDLKTNSKWNTFWEEQTKKVLKQKKEEFTAKEHRDPNPQELEEIKKNVDMTILEIQSDILSAYCFSANTEARVKTAKNGQKDDYTDQAYLAVNSVKLDLNKSGGVETVSLGNVKKKLMAKAGAIQATLVYGEELGEGISNVINRAKAFVGTNGWSEKYLSANVAHANKEPKRVIFGSNKIKNYKIIKNLSAQVLQLEKDGDKSSIKYLETLKGFYDDAIREHKKASGFFAKSGPIWKELEELSSALDSEIKKIQTLEQKNDSSNTQALAEELEQQSEAYIQEKQSGRDIEYKQSEPSTMLHQKKGHRARSGSLKPLDPHTSQPAPTEPEVGENSKYKK